MRSLISELEPEGLRRYYTIAVQEWPGGRPWFEFSKDDLGDGGGFCFRPDSRYLAWGTRSGTVAVADFPELPKQVQALEEKLHSP
jgi:hypothetical protein